MQRAWILLPIGHAVVEGDRGVRLGRDPELELGKGGVTARGRSTRNVSGARAGNARGAGGGSGRRAVRTRPTRRARR